MSYKLTQIIAAHNKSTTITPDMVVEVNGNWLVNSETDINMQYRVEKTTALCDCLLRCNICKICVHTVYMCVQPQARFIFKKKVPNQHLSTLSSIEGTQISH